MLCYAFRTMQQSTDEEDMAVESFEDIHNLFAAILAKGIGVQLKQGLYREYRHRQEELATMRGKVNMPGTINNRLQRKHVITCEYDELSDNNLLNQIVKTTVMLLLRHAKVNAVYKDDLKKQMMFFANVDTIELTTVKWASIRLQRHHYSYSSLIKICQFIVEGLLLTTDLGEYRLASWLNQQGMCRLFEKFILEYYIQKFPALTVKASQIAWVLDDDVRSPAMLPLMQSDITLQRGEAVLIIDAKYYAQTTQMHYDRHKINSSHLYQMFTYVKNKDASFGTQPRVVSGLVLYAKTEADIHPDERYRMSGNKISVQTLDLNCEFAQIAEQLNGIVAEHFGCEIGRN